MLDCFLLFSLIFLLSACPPATTRDIRNSRIAYDLGCDYLAKNQGRAAFEQFVKAVEMDPEFPEAQNALGLMYLGLKEYEKAERHFKTAIKLNPDLPDYYNNLGRTYSEMGRYKEAIENFKKALSFLVYATPHFAHANLGWAYYKNGQTKEAFSELTTAIQISPNFCLAYRTLGIIYSETDQPLDALRNFNKYRENCPNEAEPYFLIANTKHKNKLAQEEEVVSDYLRSLEKNPSFCPSLKALGTIYNQQGKREPALQYYEDFVSACGDDSEVFLNIGNLYYQKGEINRARAFLHSCIEKWKNTDSSIRCQKLLESFQK